MLLALLLLAVGTVMLVTGLVLWVTRPRPLPSERFTRHAAVRLSPDGKPLGAARAALPGPRPALPGEVAPERLPGAEKG